MSPTSPGISKQEQLVLIFQGPIDALDQGKILLGIYCRDYSTLLAVFSIKKPTMTLVRGILEDIRFSHETDR